MGTVAASNAERVLAFGRQRGVELAPLPASTARIPAEHMYGIWSALARAGRPELAIQIAEGTRLEDLQLLGFACMTAPTLTDALQTFVRYSALLNDSGRYELSIERQVIRVRWCSGDPLDVGTQLSRETAFAQLVASVRQLSAGGPRRVSFRHAAPANARAHRAFFDCTLQFDASFDEVLLPRALAEAEPPGANTPLWRYLCTQADALLCELAPRPLEARVREHVAQALASRRAPSLPAIAASLALSERSLRRALAGHRTFRALVDTVRKERALQHLRRHDLSLGAIAYECGFADASAFTHACVRWFGKPPSALRGRA
jgi:AraC-like DNA-binding protein